MTSQTTINKPGPGDGSPAGSAPAKGWRGHPWVTLVTVAVGVMMVALDGTIVAIANPAIQDDLDASLADVQWITNAYFLALAVALITAGKLGDRFGHRQTFLIGVAASRPPPAPSDCPAASPRSSSSASSRACSARC